MGEVYHGGVVSSYCLSLWTSVVFSTRLLNLLPSINYLNLCGVLDDLIMIWVTYALYAWAAKCAGASTVQYLITLLEVPLMTIYFGYSYSHG